MTSHEPISLHNMNVLIGQGQVRISHANKRRMLAAQSWVFRGLNDLQDACYDLQGPGQPTRAYLTRFSRPTAAGFVYALVLAKAPPIAA